MSTILIGVDASERSEDAIAFARQLADASGAHLVLANAYPQDAATGICCLGCGVFGFGLRLLRRHGRQHLGIQRRLLRLLALPGQLRVLVLVLRLARRATRLLHRVADHGDDRVIGQPPLARTVIVQNVTEPRLALLHLQNSRGSSHWRGEGVAKGEEMLTERQLGWQ